MVDFYCCPGYSANLKQAGGEIIITIMSLIKSTQNGDEVLRKGPWMPEEDEILVEYVRQFGARDWSSIRSKGLLPRTGKSCRLRWVNKLKPDLKR